MLQEHFLLIFKYKEIGIIKHTLTFTADTYEWRRRASQDVDHVWYYRDQQTQSVAETNYQHCDKYVLLEREAPSPQPIADRVLDGLED